MKRIATLAGAGALLLSMAGPAFGWMWFGGSDELNVTNFGMATTKTYTKADTGDNEIGGKYVKGGSITTGQATARSTVESVVNSVVSGCDCYDDVTVGNFGTAYTKTYTKADTGDNELGGMYVGGGWFGGGPKIHTGDAGATSVVGSYVNLTVVGATQ